MWLILENKSTQINREYALCSSVESSVSDSCRKGSTGEYLVIYYD